MLKFSKNSDNLIEIIPSSLPLSSRNQYFYIYKERARYLSGRANETNSSFLLQPSRGTSMKDDERDPQALRD